ncbi:hypothetical protein ABK040_008743 [Willaertia magna]
MLKTTTITTTTFSSSLHKFITNKALYKNKANSKTNANTITNYSKQQHYFSSLKGSSKESMIKNLITFHPSMGGSEQLNLHENHSNNDHHHHHTKHNNHNNGHHHRHTDSSSTNGGHQSKSGNVDLSVVYDFAKQPPTNISLKMLMEFGSKINKQTLLNSAYWLHTELPKRLGKQIRQLDNLPKGLNLMPSVRLVRDWYMQSFMDLYHLKKPKTAEEELKFTKILDGIYTRHNPTLISVAKGVHELKQKMKESIYQSDANFDLAEFSELHTALDNFYINRIGMRMLIGQHLELHRQLEEPIKDYAGLICLTTNPLSIAKDAIEDAKDLCTMAYGDAPDVIIKGKKDLSFPFIPSHLYYIYFELFKNSMRATVESHQGAKHLPPITLIIADGVNNEDISIKISDEGKGIPRKDMHKIWSYLYTTAKVMADVSEVSNFSDQHAPLAGLGYGLPISRLYARYWGGDLNVMSMEGFGTDAFLYLHRVGDKEEPLP